MDLQVQTRWSKAPKTQAHFLFLKSFDLVPEENVPKTEKKVDN